MRIAITGGTGFVGWHLARALLDAGHEVHLVARGHDHRDPEVRSLPGVRHFATGVGDPAGLAAAFAGCDAVAHCAGINREIGDQTYAAVHVTGTANVVRAAGAQGVRRLLFLSFLRARPDCGSAYHESKWAAEELVRASSLEFTVLKAGVIHGRGDHMLDHISRALFSFPVFGLVGFRPRRLRPVAVADVVDLMLAALLHGRLTRRTVAVLGPETLTLGAAVRRVAEVVGRRPLFVRLPVAAHRLLALVWEATMQTPLAARAQVRILSEGVDEPGPLAAPLPADLAPTTPFDRATIRAGLPAPGPFGLADLRCRLLRGCLARTG